MDSEVSSLLDRVEKLKELHGKCSNCKKCNLYLNGHTPPIWTHNSKYALFMEQQMKSDTGYMKKFWSIMEQYGLKEEQFAQIYTVQCKTPKSKRKNSAGHLTTPSQMHREECRIWVYDYLSALKPKKMLAFGNVVMQELTGKFNGIREHNGKVVYPKYSGQVVPTVLCVSPATLRYSEGKDYTEQLVRKSLIRFKEL